MPVDIGNPAPDFTLSDHEKKTRNLSEFRGKKLILAFFPGAFTGVCTREACTLRDELSNLNVLNAQVVGISVDSPFAQKAFATANNITFPFLSDYNREIVTRYGVVLNDFAGLQGYVSAKRSIFILDSQGIVRYRWITDDPGVEPNYVEVKEELAKIG